MEFRVLCKKSVHISYLFFNLNNVNKMASIINVYANFISEITRSEDFFEKKGQKNDAKERISDFDKLVGEILGVLVTTHLCNLIQKYRASEEAHRLDAFYSARLLVVLGF